MTSEGRRGTDRPLAAVLWMLLAALCLTVLDATGKQLVQAYPVTQVVLLRYASMAAVLVVALTFSRGWRNVRTRRPGLHVLRALLLILTTFSVFSAARALPLSQIYSIAHLAPLMVAVLASVFLGERIRPAIWACIALGFVGAMVIIRPEVRSDVDRTILTGMFWAGMTALSIAGYQVSTRLLSATEHLSSQMFFPAALGLLLAVPAGLGAWNPLDPTGWGWVAVMAASGYLAQHFMIRAFTLGEAAVVAPFHYSTLLWSTLIDLLLFQKLPPYQTFVGATFVVASGLGIIWLRWRQSAGSSAASPGQAAPRP